MSDDCRLPTDGFLEDQAHYPGGHAVGVVFPRTPEQVAHAVRGATAVLPIGAQSSVTGGATPMGELILSTAKMKRVIELTDAHLTVEPGITIAEMQETLATIGAWFPPAPTYTGATAGGIVATNAAGAATFKYGSTRDWVDAVQVVLADGTILDVRRGRLLASDRRFEIDTLGGRTVVPVPAYTMPDVPKRSAGYFAAPGMDLVDLFVGSEGTLGVITRITFRIVAPAPQTVMALIPCPSEETALAVVDALRAASRETWRTSVPAGIDASSIEDMDRRSIAIVHDDGADARNDVRIPVGTAVALLVTLELPFDYTATIAYDEIESALSDAPVDSALVRFCRLLHRFGLLDVTELAMPGDRRRAEQLIAVREAVPTGVNQRVGNAKRDVDSRIEKTAADMIVPVEHFAEMAEIYRRGFESRGLEYAVWGHVSDGNVHPNVIPRTYEDVLLGKEAILEFGLEVTRLGGCPLAEHGVGRNPIKQQLLRELYGEAAIDEMRAVKRALDPEWKLSPGVIYQK